MANSTVFELDANQSSKLTCDQPQYPKEVNSYDYLYFHLYTGEKFTREKGIQCKPATLSLQPTSPNTDLTI